jgi:hypothetical protein
LNFEVIYLVATQALAAETVHHGSGAQREPGRNQHAIRRLEPYEAKYAECRRLGSWRSDAAALADGKLPTVSSSERAGGARHSLTSGICSSERTGDFLILT